MIAQPTFEDIAADVAQLKRENAELRSRIETLHPGASPRGWRRSLPAVLTSAIVVTGLLALTGSRATAGGIAGPLTVRAPFRVVDKNGNRVMSVSNIGALDLWSDGKSYAHFDGDGGGHLYMRDSNGQDVTVLGANASGGFLQVRNSRNAREALGAALETNDDGGLLQLNDASGKRRAALGITSAGNVQFSILNLAGNTVAQLDDQGGGDLKLANPAGIVRVEAGIISGNGGVITYGPNRDGVLRGE